MFLVFQQKTIKGIEMVVRAFFALALVAFCVTANAEGFYAGAGAGITKIEHEEQGVSFDDSPFGWRLTAGYDFNDNFAIEGMYVNTGEASDTVQGIDVKAELSGFGVYLVGLAPNQNGKTKVFGKLGYYSGEQETTLFGVTVDEDADGFAAGAGIRFDMDNKMTLRADFDWIDSDLDTVWAISVGFQVRFGN